MKRILCLFSAFLCIVFTCSCASDCEIPEEDITERLISLCPEIRFSTEAEKLCETEDGITHTLLAENKTNTYILELLTDKITGEVKSCCVICTDSKNQTVRDYSLLCLSVLKTFTQNTDGVCKQLLSDLPLIPSDNAVKSLKQGKYILRSYPAASGFAFVVENSEKSVRNETTAFPTSPEITPVTMETLTVPTPH